MLAIFRYGAKSTVNFCRQNLNVQVATLTGRTTRGEPLVLRKGFPYYKRHITHLEALMDATVRRVEEENAKIIVVDGPIAAGKTAVIKQLAEEFDMFHIPEPTMDLYYLTRSGYDLRNLDEQLPEDVRTFDHKNFCITPNHPNVVTYQALMLRLRFSVYIDALAHVLNTGQGVILERSLYSDHAFAEAMTSEGFLTESVRNHLNVLRDFAKPLLLKPHVIIYLDVPVNKVQERIKARNYSYEVNSPALTLSYLQKLENEWKYNYLKEASYDSDVLIYDWSDGGDVDLMIEDLEKLNLNPSDMANQSSGKFRDWYLWRRELRLKRITYTNEKHYLMELLNYPVFDIPEFVYSSESYEIRNKLYKQAPGNEYEHGYNPKQGDSFFKILLGFGERSVRSHGRLGSY